MRKYRNFDLFTCKRVLFLLEVIYLWPEKTTRRDMIWCNITGNPVNWEWYTTKQCISVMWRWRGELFGDRISRWNYRSMRRTSVPWRRRISRASCLHREPFQSALFYHHLSHCYYMSLIKTSCWLSFSNVCLWFVFCPYFPAYTDMNGTVQPVRADVPVKYLLSHSLTQMDRNYGTLLMNSVLHCSHA